MTKFLKQYGIAAITALTVIASCGDEPTNTPDVNFDRERMLSQYALTIMNGYEELQLATSELEKNVIAFTEKPTSANRSDVINSWELAYIYWQSCSMFEVGPAADISLRANANTFPTDVNRINANMLSSNYNLDVVANWSAKGFPAIELLLYGAHDSIEVLKLYTTDENAFKRKEYLKAITVELNSKIKSVLNAWKGGYREQFIKNTGTDVGSSISQLVNQINFDWEVIKNPKIGIPLGIKTMGIPLPKNVEAYYSGESESMALINATAIRDFCGQGLFSYLDALNARHGDMLLAAAIRQQMNKAIAELEYLQHYLYGPLSDAVIQNPEAVQKAYTELQKTVVLLKTDMPSALGVMITYQDADGD